ncbi:MAG: hypothetical protein GY953_04280, partial [bacterium]|nr:hypothetical protein [bacterium]
MHRRSFLQSMAAAPAVTMAAGSAQAEDRRLKTSLFLDHWHLDLIQSAELRLGQPKLRPEATYEDPLIEGMSSWPTVWRDEAVGKYRMLYSAKWRPLTLLAAESDDGYEWRPTPHPGIQPAGGKLAPHHIFTLPSGSGGSTY